MIPMRQEKLGKANKYYETLKPTCVEVYFECFMSIIAATLFWSTQRWGVDP